MRLISLLAALGLACGLLTACGDSGSSTPTPAEPTAPSVATPSEPSGPTKPRIVILSRGEKTAFWTAARAGAIKAASEHRAFDVVWKEPSSTDPVAQAKVLESVAAPGVVALVVAPADKTLQAPLEALAAKKLPIVLLDSDLSGEKFVSAVTCNPATVGQPAAAKLQATFYPDLATTEAKLQDAAKTPCIGTDASPATLAALEKGTLQGLVVRNGFRLGYLGVKTAIRAAKEERNLPKQQDAGAVLVTKENLATPEVQTLLQSEQPK